MTVDAVDIVPDVRDAMALFTKENDNVLQRPNWRLIADDGRHFLKISPQRYDVITADATHPAAAESWVLYTQEYYQLVKSKLTEQGVFAQWLPLHNMAPTDYLSVLRTFRSVFPHTLLLFTNRYTLMVEEFLAWQYAIDRNGLAGLRTTRIQQYRHAASRWLREYLGSRDQNDR